jgi:hypothetical protein
LLRLGLHGLVGHGVIDEMVGDGEDGSKKESPDHVA